MDLVIAYLGSSKLLVLASIPVVSALVGWLTNWLAIKMTFYPVERVGPPLFGWQGIIPRNSERIAARTVRLVTGQLFRVDDVIDRVDPRRLAAELEPVYDSITDEIVEEVISTQSPAIWELTPRPLKEQVQQQVRRGLPDLVERIVGRREDLVELFDLEHLVLDNLTGQNKRLLNEMFLRCGRPEFRFIVRCGLYFGFLLGLLQSAVWVVAEAWWLLPVAGIIVGYLTNWIALKMIFRPLLPRRFLVVTYQGLFLRRQAEVSREYARLLAERIIIPQKIVDALVSGERAGRFIDLVHREVRRIVDEKTGLFRGVVLFAIGTASYAQMKERVTRKVVELIPRYTHRAEAYWREAMDLEETVFRRLSRLPPVEFEDVLHTCFKQDEWMLIAVGAVVGLVAGLLQALGLGLL